jgi:hypothetical protein
VRAERGGTTPTQARQSWVGGDTYCEEGMGEGGSDWGGGELARGPAQGGERVGSAQGKFENLNSFENCTELELAKIMPSQTQKIQIKYGPAGFQIRNNYPY